MKLRQINEAETYFNRAKYNRSNILRSKNDNPYITQIEGTKEKGRDSSLGSFDSQTKEKAENRGLHNGYRSAPKGIVAVKTKKIATQRLIDKSLNPKIEK